MASSNSSSESAVRAYVVNNYPQIPPSNIVGVFDGKVPFGSEFIYFCAESGSGVNTKYTALWRVPGSDTINAFDAVRQADGTYTFRDREEYESYDLLSGTHPEYCYSSVPGGGQFHQLSSGGQLQTLMIVVICSLLILKTVFGGIRWIRSKKYRV